jgi:hypothetical protein
VSPSPGDGKTSLAVNLAAAMAESGRRTLLLNGDFRRPRIVSALGPDAQAPLPFMLEDVQQIGVRAMLTRSGVPNMRVFDLSAVPASAVELTRATVECMPELAGLAEQIVIDSSPLGATAEVLDLVPFADTIVFVARVGHTNTNAARRAVTIVRDLSDAPMLLALGGLKRERSEYYEYGGPPRATTAKPARRRSRLRRRRRRATPATATTPAPPDERDEHGEEPPAGADDTPFAGTGDGLDDAEREPAAEGEEPGSADGEAGAPPGRSDDRAAYEQVE